MPHDYTQQGREAAITAKFQSVSLPDFLIVAYQKYLEERENQEENVQNEIRRLEKEVNAKKAERITIETSEKSLIHEKKEKENSIQGLQIKKLEMTDLANNPVVVEEDKTPQPIDYQPLNATINYDDFAKMDIRTGTILTAENVKGSDKLLKLSVDLGFETRLIMSGIAKHFKAEDIIGQQIVVLANLAPRKMMGAESNGMVLLSEDSNGKLSFVSPPQGVGNGFIVK